MNLYEFLVESYKGESPAQRNPSMVSKSNKTYLNKKAKKELELDKKGLVECPDCYGKGKVEDPDFPGKKIKCENCNGKGTLKKQKDY